MRKRLTAAVLAGTLGIGGVVAAVAIPALADTTPSPSASASPGTSGTAPGTDQRESRIKELLKGLVDDKTLTQAQADKVASTLAESGPGGGPGGKGFGHGGGMGRGGFGLEGPESIDAVAKVLGMSADDVRTALRGGSTLADLAKKQGKSEDDVIKVIVDAAKTRIAQAVKDGKLTQAQADQISGTLSDRVRSAVENGRPKGGPDGPGGHDRWMRPGAPDGQTTPAPSSPTSPSAPASPSGTTQTSVYVA